MSYLIQEISLFLLCAFIVGVVYGWVVRGIRARRDLNNVLDQHQKEIAQLRKDNASLTDRVEQLELIPASGGGEDWQDEYPLTEIKDIKSKEMNSPEMPLYNFHISNDNSYIADTYIVHNKGGGGGGCFLADTLITMADGSTKEVQKVDLGDNVAEGGKVFATGKFLVENLHDYKGIKVSGSHMVNEDGNWVRVEDSKHGKPLGEDEHTVYVFGSENRRILINGILFTDYFEITDQEKLLKFEAEGQEFVKILRSLERFI
jgi:hypothetical protein